MSGSFESGQDPLERPAAGPAGERMAGSPAGLVIETRRLLLRRPVAADAPAIAEEADNIHVARNLLSMPHPYRLGDALAWIAEPPHPHGQKHLICLKAIDRAPRPIGAVSVDLRLGPRHPTLGIWLGEAHWGKGYAPEAFHAAIDYAFLHQGHERLFFTCRVTNMAGRRAIEKCGFQHVAQELEQSLVHRSVVAVDRFALDRGTWDSLRHWEPLRFSAEGAKETAA